MQRFSTETMITELKPELKVCQFVNGLQLKNDKNNNLRRSNLNKDL